MEATELSVVIPCLNEAETLAMCVDSARAALARAGISGEVVVADNGSADGSQAIAAAHGARVVPVAARGYGSALLGGIAAARGRYVLMGDADGSHDFADIPRFATKLREGYDLVQGCRLPAGGGTVVAGSMSVLNRWVGNPFFSFLVRRWFGAPIHDVHCGMRAFRRDLVPELDLRCTGMEFASEMIIKATLHRANIAEVPITMHPDGRNGRPPHLRPFRDGWRHLRFYLLFSPRWLFLVPGVATMLLGVLGYALALPGVRVGTHRFEIHTLLFASLALICGYQAVLFSVLAKVYATTHGLMPRIPWLERAYGAVKLEHGIVAGALGMLVGAVLLGAAVLRWWSIGFSPADYGLTLRWVIPGVTAASLGVQTILASFFLSVLGLRTSER